MSILVLMLSMFSYQNEPSDSTLGNIIFYREYRFQGGAWRHKIVKGDSTLGILKNNSLFVYTCKPGEYDFQVKKVKQSSVHLKVEGGKAYYVSFGFRERTFSFPGSHSVDPDLDIETSAIGLRAIEKIKLKSSKKVNQKP
jgi:hypothetical protein